MRDSGEEVNRRFLHDRRKQPTPFISRYTFIGGRRRTVRREEERKKYTFVDLYSTPLFLALLLLLILNVSDSYLTITLIKNNVAAEANPIMAFYLEYGHLPFFTAKFLITAIPIFIFCICKNFSITKASLVSAIFIYLSIITYELNMLFQFLPPF
jgi:hypothetical protein